MPLIQNGDGLACNPSVPGSTPGGGSRHMRNPALDDLVSSGEIASYELSTESRHSMGDGQRLLIRFRSGAALEVASDCGTISDSSSWLEISG